MKVIVIKGLPDWKLNTVIKDWKFYITNVGGKFELDNNNVVIIWEDLNPSILHHIIDVCDDLIENKYVIDSISGIDIEVSQSIKNLTDNHLMIFDGFTRDIIDIDYVNIHGIDEVSEVFLGKDKVNFVNYIIKKYINY